MLQDREKREYISTFTKRSGGCWFSVALNRQDQVVACSFSPNDDDSSRRGLNEMIARRFKTVERQTSRSLQAIDALSSIFEGKELSTVPQLDLSRTTALVHTIYDIVRKIPKSRVCTYGLIAETLGTKGYSRAVGNAMARNPFVLFVPCHRVVPSTLKVGNFGHGPRVKMELLKRENVLFQGNRISRASVWYPRERGAWERGE